MGKGCGGGGLRILPHKSWNVYNYDNKLKVKADERKHAEEEKVKRERQRAADAEFRLNLMRRKLHGRNRSAKDEDEVAENNGMEESQDEPASSHGPRRGGNVKIDGDEAGVPAKSKRERKSRKKPTAPEMEPEPEPLVSLNDSAGHINLFTDIEAQIKKSAKNKEAEDEKKDKQHQEMKKLVPTTFFGEFAKDETGKRPWYTTPTLGGAKVSSESAQKTARNEFFKSAIDPLAELQVSLLKSSSQQSADSSASVSTLTAFERAKAQAKENARLLRVGPLFACAASSSSLASSASTAPANPAHQDTLRNKLLLGGYAAPIALSYSTATSDHSQASASTDSTQLQTLSSASVSDSAAALATTPSSSSSSSSSSAVGVAFVSASSVSITTSSAAASSSSSSTSGSRAAVVSSSNSAPTGTDMPALERVSSLDLVTSALGPDTLSQNPELITALAKVLAERSLKRKSKKHKSRRKRSRSRSSSPSRSREKRDRKDHHRRKRSKRSRSPDSHVHDKHNDKKSSTKKQKHKHNSSDDDQDILETAVSSMKDSTQPPATAPHHSSSSSLEELRRQRLEREQVERMRVSALLGVPEWATHDAGALMKHRSKPSHSNRKR